MDLPHTRIPHTGLEKGMRIPQKSLSISCYFRSLHQNTSRRWFTWERYLLSTTSGSGPRKEGSSSSPLSRPHRLRGRQKYLTSLRKYLMDVEGVYEYERTGWLPPNLSAYTKMGNKRCPTCPKSAIKTRVQRHYRSACDKGNEQEGNGPIDQRATITLFAKVRRTYTPPALPFFKSLSGYSPG